MAHSVQPEARGGHALVYYNTLRAMIMFGGDRWACTTLYQDTWLWDGTAWKKLAVDVPDTHSVVAAAYFASQDSTALSGGWAGGKGYWQVTSSMYGFTRKP